MTLASTTTKVSYNGDGSNRDFDVTFKFLQNADVKAILRAANGTETVWTIDVNYSLSGAGNESGGTLTASLANVPAVGETLIIKRNAAETQQTDLPTGGRFATEAVETALDKLTMLVQQLLERLGRTASLAETSGTSGLTLPEPEADKVLGWNAGGTDLENKVGAGITDHGALTGLADDDHTQYLLVDGTRAMTGALDMGSQAITAVDTVDGRDVSVDGGKLDGIAVGAEVNPDVVSQAEAETGSATTERIWTAQRVAQAIAAQAQPLGQVVGVNGQTGTSYTLVEADKGKAVEMNNASANTLTVPPNGTVPFAVNTVVHVTQTGAGQTTLVQGSGVTIHSPATLKLRAQYSTATLRQSAANVWVLSGDLATS